MAYKRKLLCLLVTEEQEKMLEGIFQANDWDLIKATPEDHPAHMPPLI